MEFMETIVIALITTILSVVCSSCGRIANERYTKETTECQTEENDTLKIERYRYFDLFTMQGIEPCDNDSCITVTQKGNKVIVDYKLPERDSLILNNTGEYWHSRAEFDMNKNRYYLTMSESWPRRYDRFIRNDTILEFCQMYSTDEVYKTVYLKTRDEYTIFDLKTENYTDTDPQKIYRIISDVVNGENNDITYVSKWNVKREANETQFIDIESGFVITREYPELLIWGGNYGFGVEKNNTLLVGTKCSIVYP
ncbi:MAG: hypothetical protein K2I64_00415 [Muribaculaceae bacterium]|nr:hypothetical protein [Muribaculaceae bacterium]